MPGRRLAVVHDALQQADRLPVVHAEVAGERGDRLGRAPHHARRDPRADVASAVLELHVAERDERAAQRVHAERIEPEPVGQLGGRSRLGCERIEHPERDPGHDGARR